MNGLFLWISWAFGVGCGLLGGRVAVLSVRWLRTRRRVSEMHVEEYRNLSKLRRYCLDNPDLMLMLLPHPKVEKLGFVPNVVGLHLHMAHSSHPLSFEDQRKHLEWGLDELACYGFDDIKDFAPGKWDFNEDTVRACKAVGLTRFHVYWSRGKLAKLVRKHGLTLVVVKKYMHDWDIQ